MAMTWSSAEKPAAVKISIERRPFHAVRPRTPYRVSLHTVKCDRTARSPRVKNAANSKLCAEPGPHMCDRFLATFVRFD